ncbi:MAG: SBBP repeat-containing protein, partial [Planctomycetota bacterium]
VSMGSLVGSTNSCDGLEVRSFGPLGGSDVFVARVDGCQDAATASVRWVSQVGGTDADRATAMAVGSDGSIYVAGTTRSNDLPSRRPWIQGRFAAASPLVSVGDAFLVRLTSDGELTACTYLGREGDEVIRSMFVEDDGSLVVCGHTTSQVFQTTEGAFQREFRSASVLVPDGFLARIEPDLSRFRWSTLYGGQSADWFLCVRPRPGGGYVCGGWHASVDLPMPDGREATELNGLRDAFVVEFTRDGSSLLDVWSFGGAGFDQVTDLVVHSEVESGAGRIFVTGWTNDGQSFPSSVGEPGRSREQFSDEAFVAELGAEGELLRSRVFGGAAEDHPKSVCIDRTVEGRPELILVGDSRSDRFPGNGKGLLGPVAVQGFVLGFDLGLESTELGERFRFARMSRPRCVQSTADGLVIAGWAVGLRTNRLVQLGAAPGSDSVEGFLLGFAR